MHHETKTRNESWLWRWKAAAAADIFSSIGGRSITEVRIDKKYIIPLRFAVERNSLSANRPGLSKWRSRFCETDSSKSLLYSALDLVHSAVRTQAVIYVLIARRDMYRIAHFRFSFFFFFFLFFL